MCEIFIEDIDDINTLLSKIEALIEAGNLEKNEDLSNFYWKLFKYKAQLKKHSDDMRWKEASKIRKLKSQIRARKI